VDEEKLLDCMLIGEQIEAGDSGVGDVLKDFFGLTDTSVNMDELDVDCIVESSTGVVKACIGLEVELELGPAAVVTDSDSVPLRKNLCLRTS